MIFNSAKLISALHSLVSFLRSEEIIHHKNKITQYAGKILMGFVEQAYLAGREVFKNGKFLENECRKNNYTQ